MLRTIHILCLGLPNKADLFTIQSETLRHLLCVYIFTSYTYNYNYNLNNNMPNSFSIKELTFCVILQLCIWRSELKFHDYWLPVLVIEFFLTTIWDFKSILMHFTDHGRKLYIRYLITNFDMPLKEQKIDQLFTSVGILMSRHSPTVSTPLEPCRVAPYVNLPSLRASNAASCNTQRQFNGNAAAAAAAAAAFSAFDPALLTAAAHQVIFIWPKSVFSNNNKIAKNQFH